MLILTRRPGESLVIELPGDQVAEVTVMRVKGQQVKLSIETPRCVPVVRSEILQAEAAKVAT